MPLNDFRSVHLPYCLERQPDGRYVVLNREYKPLGFKTDDWIKYEEYPIAVKFKRLPKTTIAKISYDRSNDPKRIFLYNDGCIPTNSDGDMQKYLDRLRILAALELPLR